MTRKKMFFQKRECHNCTQNTHLLFITERFGSVCRNCHKNELSYLEGLLSNLISNCGIQAFYTEKDLSKYLIDVDSALEGIKVIWEQVYAHYRGDYKLEFQTIYKNLTRNENASSDSLAFIREEFTID